MTAASIRRRESKAPALLAAAALHVGVFLALVYLARPSMDLPVGTAVPINLVASAPTTDSRAAEAAPETQEAAVDTPVPQAKAPTPPPAPPTPVPPAPRAPALEKPTPKPAPQKPSRPVPTPAKSTFSLDALQASIAKTAHSAPPHPAFARRGPTRAETAPVARVDAGQGVSQSDIAGLSQLLERLWNPNCNAAGGDTVVIPVKYTVSFDGHVIGRIVLGGHAGSSDPVVTTAARRAIDAIHEAEPYAETFRGQTFTVIFDAKKACANR
jgi:outer membrane biosynthesis protein TonB